MDRLNVCPTLQQELDESGHVSAYSWPILNSIGVPRHCCQGAPIDQNHIVVTGLQERISDLLGTAPLPAWSLLRKSMQIEDGGMRLIEI